jgi:1,4-alpha-glucan branching enzyme
MSERRGALALVLHTHMPYVEGFGTWPFGEEWLWEAVACVYLPLLEVLDGAQVTVGLTPVLCDQLEAMRGEPGDRYLRFLRETRAEVHAEDSAGLDRGGEAELAAEVRRAAGDYEQAADGFERRGRDLLAALGALRGVELWTSAATHAVLPMLATDAGIDLQLATGIASHRRRFGGWDGGLWLPECAYSPVLDAALERHGVRRVCVDQTAAHGVGAPEQLEPVGLAAGGVAVPVDWQTVELIWHEREGYPAHHGYRDYHRRTIHDLRPWANSGEPYDHAAALALAREHARDFLGRVAERAAGGGLVCCALDTELLGHWWYEGPEWLATVLSEAEAEGVELVTVAEGLERVPAVERELEASTWGAGKDLSTWGGAGVAELAFGARRAELSTLAAAARGTSSGPALERAARELLALQSSDWAFMTTRALASDYPLRRIAQHRADLDAALAALTDCGPVPEPAVRSLAPDLDVAPLTEN